MILIKLIVIQISSFLSFAAAFNMSDLDSDIEEIQEIRGSSVARTSSQTSLRGFLSISANSQVSLDFQNITSVRTYYALHISL